MSKLYKGLAYTDEEHLLLTQVLEEKLINMLKDKWTHRWSTGYSDDDRGIIRDVAIDIRQVLHDNIIKALIQVYSR